MWKSPHQFALTLKLTDFVCMFSVQAPYKTLNYSLFISQDQQQYCNVSIAGLKFKLKELKLSHWATLPVFFGQVTSAYEGIGTVSSQFLALLSNS